MKRDTVEIPPSMVRFLSSRERSSGEVLQRLARDGVRGERALPILQALVESRLVDDRRFAENRLEYRIREGYGPLRIKAELIQAGLSRELAEDILAGADRDAFLEGARSQLRRRTLNRGESDKKRMAAFLLRRGFTRAQAEAVLGKDLYGDEFEGI